MDEVSLTEKDELGSALCAGTEMTQAPGPGSRGGLPGWTTSCVGGSYVTPVFTQAS